MPDNSEYKSAPSINITSESGQVLPATPEQLESLKSLGYTKETPQAEGARLTEHAAESYYSSTGQQIGAGLEGALSGASLGISDWLLDSEDHRARARYNPGTRLAGELLGATLPAVLSGGEGLAAEIARLTPTGAAAALSGRALGAGTKAALALEGAIQGTGAAASHAILNNDPVTVEALAAGAGSGALFAYGLGLLSGGINKVADHAEGALSERHAEAARAVLKRENVSLRQFSEHAAEFNQAVDRTLKTVEAEVTPKRLAALVKQTAAAADEVKIAAAAQGRPANHLSELLRRARSGALEGGEAGANAVRAYQTAVKEAAERAGVEANIPTMGRQAAEAVGEMAQLRGALKRLPSSPEELARMGDAKAGDLIEKLRRGLPDKGNELDGLRAAMRDSLAGTLKEAGLRPTSDSVDGLVDGLNAYRLQLKKVAATVDSHVAADVHKGSTFLGLIGKTAKLAAARKAGAVARAAGAGVGLSALAYHAGGLSTGAVVAELMGLRAAAMGHVEELVAKIAPVASRSVKRMAPVTERLRERLDGSRDDAKNPRVLAANRAREIVAMQQVAPDASFSAAEPLQSVDPELALKMSQQLMAGLQHLGKVAPRDPGATNNFLNSDWHPSDTETQRLAAAYEAVRHPMQAMERLLTGQVDQAAADALWATVPSLMQHAALRLLERAPELQAKSDLPTRAALSTAFRVPLDGLMHPTSVAALQAQFIPSGQGMATGKRGHSAPSASPSGGRPPAVDSNVAMTRTQSLMR